MQRLLRWSGLSFMIGGLLFALVMLFHPVDSVEAYQTALWVPLHIVMAGAMLLLVWGLIGAYVRQSEETGLTGFIGFLLASAGYIVVVGAGLIVEAIIFPTLADLQPALIEASGSLTAALVPGILTTQVLYVLGFLLLGIATFRANVFPRWTGAGLAIGGSLSLLAPLPHIILQLGAVLLAATTSVMGYQLWSE